MNHFTIKCLFCGNSDQRKFQTTMEDWEGWSEYTVMENGYVEFKCLSCGTFCSGDWNKRNLGSNKIDMFELTCNNCDSKKWSFSDSLGEEFFGITCDGCSSQEGGWDEA